MVFGLRPVVDGFCAGHLSAFQWGNPDDLGGFPRMMSRFSFCLKRASSRDEALARAWAEWIDPRQIRLEPSGYLTLAPAPVSCSWAGGGDPASHSGIKALSPRCSLLQVMSGKPPSNQQSLRFDV